MDGWIKLHRKLTENILWTAEPFSRGQAWVDLLMLANYKDGFIYKRGNRVEVKRGQVGWSVVSLAERWKWSRGKVNRFINDLKVIQQIEQQKTNITTLITLVNYEDYQGDGQDIEQQTGSRRAADGQQTDTKKKEKKENNSKNLLNRKLKFDTEVKEYKDKYPMALLADFSRYWIEPNKSRTKMRFELQPTWSMGGRLATWYQRAQENIKDTPKGTNLGGRKLPPGYGEPSPTAMTKQEFDAQKEKKDADTK